MIEVTNEMREYFNNELWDINIDHPEWEQHTSRVMKRIIELHEANKPKPEPVVWVVWNGWKPVGVTLDEEKAITYAQSKQQHSDLSGDFNAYRVAPLYTAPPTQALQHSDDLAVDQFAQALKDKMRKSREKGRSGWDDKQQCPNGRLQQMLIDHLGKGDPLDVGAFAMMLFIRGERTNPPTREPLSEEEIEKLVPWQGDPKDPFFNRIEFARAIEQYHGIGTSHEPT